MYKESIILKLYNGELHPYRLLPHGQEYTEYRKEVFSCIDKFAERLNHVSADLKERYMTMNDDIAALHSYEAEEMFRAGVSLGLTMMAEAVGYTPKYFCDDSTP